MTRQSWPARKCIEQASDWHRPPVVQSAGPVAPQNLPHIFERFYRGKSAINGIAGTGIGLAEARQIVEQHGGTISVESQEGSGTTFFVRLPVNHTGA
jgi:signal transduction histidine kinase